MMFCQACGAKNAGGARFCNMCGARIAEAGEPGGPVEAPPGVEPSHPESSDLLPSVPTGPWASGPDKPAGANDPMPSMGSSDTGVTLARIGVQSSRKMWSVLGLVAVALVGLGAFSTWLVTRGDTDDGAEGGHAGVDDPFVIGTPLPQGAETPDEDFLTGKPEAAKAPLSDAQGVTGSDTPTSPRPSGSTASRSRAQRAADSPSAPSRTAPPKDRGAQQGADAPADPSPDGSETGEAERADADGSPAGPTGGDDAQDDDIGMDLYGARVRYAVQRYYGARAQGCFDRATRNEPTLSGTVVVGLHIGGDGGVTQGSVVRNSTGDAELADCLAGQVRGWQLPPPPDGPVNMEMPFSR